MIIKYITNVRIPTPRAQGYAIMKMCSEFAKAGAQISLFIPDRADANLIGKDPFDFYKIENNFKIKRIPSFDFLGKTLKFGKLFYWVDVLSFLVTSKLNIKMAEGDILYTRDFLASLFFPGQRSILELHDITSKSFLFRRAIKKPALFFVLNNNLKNELVDLGVPASKIFISPSGVDIGSFDIDLNKEEAREKLNFPKDQKIVLYSGQLYSWKGAETLADAASLVPGVKFLFVGGVEPELSKFKERYKNRENIYILPFQERSVVPIYLKTADVLVLPNSSHEQVSVRYTSPLKLFEYMASGRPIVASDLSSIREAVSDTECVFAEPDNPESFAAAIKKILSDEKFAQEISKNAYQKAKQYSWDKRAETILKTINNYLS